MVGFLAALALDGGALAGDRSGGWWAECLLGVAGLVAGDGGDGGCVGDGRGGLLGDVDDATLDGLLHGMLPRAALAAWCPPAAA